MSNDAPWPTARYRLREPAHIGLFPGDEYLVRETGTEIVFDGKPGPHMEPLDEAGAEALRRVGPQTLNFTTIAPMTAGDEDDLLAERTAVAVTKAMAPVLAALTAALGGQAPPAASPADSATPELPPPGEPSTMQGLPIPAGATFEAPPSPAPPVPPPAPPLPPRAAPRK